MTPEEAGEEILAGRPYETCNLCRGTGKREMLVKDGRRIPTKCTVCFKKGNVPRTLYHLAAKTLGIPVPPQPQGAIEKSTPIEDPDFNWKARF